MSILRQKTLVSPPFSLRVINEIPCKINLSILALWGDWNEFTLNQIFSDSYDVNFFLRHNNIFTKLARLYFSLLLALESIEYQRRIKKWQWLRYFSTGFFQVLRGSKKCRKSIFHETGYNGTVSVHFFTFVTIDSVKYVNAKTCSGLEVMILKYTIF